MTASDIPTCAHHLRRAGCQTCLSGKIHFVGPDQLHGFEERPATDIHDDESCFPWDHQPLQRASERCVRNHMDLNVVEENQRFPRAQQRTV